MMEDNRVGRRDHPGCRTSVYIQNQINIRKDLLPGLICDTINAVERSKSELGVGSHDDLGVMVFGDGPADIEAGKNDEYVKMEVADYYGDYIGIVNVYGWQISYELS